MTTEQLTPQLESVLDDALSETASKDDFDIVKGQLASISAQVVTAFYWLWFYWLWS